MAQRQINIRIDEGEFELLAAAAFVEDASPPDVVRALLQARLRELAVDPDVKDALRARRARARKRQEDQATSVSSLEAKRQKRGRGHDGR